LPIGRYEKNNKKKLNAYEINIKKIDVGVGYIDDAMCSENFIKKGHLGTFVEWAPD
jgi:hypothetical protein